MQHVVLLQDGELLLHYYTENANFERCDTWLDQISGK
jgi:hypothetical protein